jgi:hypothetical protein
MQFMTQKWNRPCVLLPRVCLLLEWCRRWCHLTGGNWVRDRWTSDGQSLGGDGNLRACWRH